MSVYIRDSKNLLTTPYFNKSGYAITGITMEYGDDGVLSLNGTCSGTACVIFLTHEAPVVPGKTYTYKINASDYTYASGVVEVRDLKKTVITRLGADKGNGCTFTVPVDLEENGYVVSVNIYIYNKDGFTLNNFTCEPMLNEGSVSLPFKPWNNVSKVRTLVKASNPKNLIPLNCDFTEKTENGVTFKALPDGRIRVSSAETVNATFAIAFKTTTSFPKGEYIILSNSTWHCYFMFQKYVNGAWQKNLQASMANGNKVSFSIKDSEANNYFICSVVVVQGFTGEHILEPMLIEGPENLIPFPYTQNGSEAYGGKFVVDSDGSVTAIGTPTDYVGFTLASKIEVKNDMVYVLHGYNSYGVSGNLGFYRADGTRITSINTAVNTDYKVSKSDYPDLDYIDLSVKRSQNNVAIGGNVYPLLLEGPENLIRFPYIYSTRKINGVSFVVNDNGSIIITREEKLGKASQFMLANLALKTNTPYIISGGKAVSGGYVIVNARKVNNQGVDVAWVDSKGSSTTGILNDGEKSNYCSIYITDNVLEIGESVTIYPKIIEDTEPEPETYFKNIECDIRLKGGN